MFAKSLDARYCICTLRDLYQLPRGITGFSTPQQSLPATPFASFKRLVYQVARTIGAEVTRLETAEGRVEPNYHIAELYPTNTALVIVCNAHFPWLALVNRWPSPPAPLEFVEHPPLQHALSAHPDFQVLPVLLFEAASTPERLHQLAPAELQQVRRWQPQRLGDLIFNFWD